MNESPTSAPDAARDLGPDPAWLDGAVIECAACHRPIAVRRGDEAGKCPACGASSAAPAPVLPDDFDGDLDRLPVDLRRAPARVEDLGDRPGAPRLPRLREAFEEAKTALAGPHLVADELRATWLAATLSRIHGATGDPVRERAALEAALAQLAVPAYRTLVIARLARAAAFAGHVELADQWLARVAVPIEIGAVDDDVAVARALLLLKRGRFDEVVALLGDDDEGHDFAGLVRPFADLVRIDALERSGRGLAAYALYRKAIKRHGAIPLQGLVMYYRLGVATRRWILAVGFVVMLVIVALLALAYRLVTDRG